MECNIFGNRYNWKSILFISSISPTSESGIAERARIAGIVVIDLDGLWTFIPEWNDFYSI